MFIFYMYLCAIILEASACVLFSQHYFSIVSHVCLVYYLPSFYVENVPFFSGDFFWFLCKFFHLRFSRHLCTSSMLFCVLLSSLSYMFCLHYENLSDFFFNCKNDNLIEKILIFFSKHRLWVHVRTASRRRF